MPKAIKKPTALRKAPRRLPQARIRAERTAAAAADVRAARCRAALDVLAREGLEAATVKRIAEVAGVNHGLVHYYFGSKEAMLLEAFTAAQQRELDGLDKQFGTAESGETLDHLWSVFRKSLRQPKQVRLATQITALSIYKPELISGITQSNHRVAVALGQIFSARLGRVYRARDAVTARLFMGGMVTLGLWSLRENPDELDEAFDTLVRMIMTGLKRP